MIPVERTNIKNFTSFAGSLSALTAGILFAWTSPSIPQLISKEYPGDITIEEASYLTVIPPLAAILGSPVFPYLMNKIGRKKTLLLMFITQTVVWIMIMFAESIYTFYISRFINGFGDACLYTVLPTYIGEVTTPSVRGTWGNSMQVMIYVGQLLINAVGGFCSIRTTAYVFVPLPFIFLFSFMTMPETPYYLLIKDKTEEAKRSLQRLRNKEDVEQELKQITSDIERQTQESGNWKDLFTSAVNRKALFAGAFIRGAQQLSGIAAFNVYTNYLFLQAGGELSHAVSSVIFQTILVVMNVIGSCTLDKLGRKKSMIFSCASCCLILGAEAAFFYIKVNTTIDVSHLMWFPLVGLIVYVIVYSIGLGIVPTLILSELFSASIKAKAVCVINVIFCLYVSGGTKLFQYLTDSFGLHAPFMVFCVCCLVSTILSFFFVPETKGKTLEEIQQSMMKSRK